MGWSRSFTVIFSKCILGNFVLRQSLLLALPEGLIPNSHPLSLTNHPANPGGSYHGARCRRIPPFLPSRPNESSQRAKPLKNICTCPLNSICNQKTTDKNRYRNSQQANQHLPISHKFHLLVSVYHFFAAISTNSPQKSNSTNFWASPALPDHQHRRCARIPFWRKARTPDPPHKLTKYQFLPHSNPLFT